MCHYNSMFNFNGRGVGLVLDQYGFGLLVGTNVGCSIGGCSVRQFFDGGFDMIGIDRLAEELVVNVIKELTRYGKLQQFAVWVPPQLQQVDGAQLVL